MNPVQKMLLDKMTDRFVTQSCVKPREHRSHKIYKQTSVWLRFMTVHKQTITSVISNASNQVHGLKVFTVPSWANGSWVRILGFSRIYFGPNKLIIRQSMSKHKSHQLRFYKQTIPAVLCQLCITISWIIHVVGFVV